MTYMRVIPRDLFNEASLLKCLGRLYLVTENLAAVRLVHNERQPFDVVQDDADGSICCINVGIVINGKSYSHSRPLNSRDDWPLYISRDDDEWPVFDDYGNLSPEFKALLT